MTTQEFAQKMREKYPDGISSDGRSYAEIDDAELVNRVVQKHPIYKSQIDDPETISLANKSLFGNQIKEAFTSGVEKVVGGFREQQKATNPAQLLEGGLKSAAGGVGVLTSPLAPIFAPIGRQMAKVSDAVSETKPFREYGEGSVGTEGDTATRVLEDVVNVTELIGAVTGGKGVLRAPPAARRVASTVIDAADAGIGRVADATHAAIDVAKTPYKVGKDFAQAAANPIPKNVQLVLKETKSSKFDEYVDISRKATEDWKASTPLEHAGVETERALTMIQKRLNRYGEQKQTALSQAKVGNKPMGTVAVKARQQLHSSFANQILDASDRRLIDIIDGELTKLGDNPSIKQLDAFVDFAQDQLYKSGRDLTIPVTERVTGRIRQVVGELNSKIKAEAGDPYTKANDNFSSLVELRNELNKKLGYDAEKGGSLLKRIFSPSDARTKNMFADVKKVTGIDLVNEAVLAKYVMDVIGDVRQKSLLDRVFGGQAQVPLSSAGAIKMVASELLSRTVGKQIKSPEIEISRARAMTQP